MTEISYYVPDGQTLADMVPALIQYSDEQVLVLQNIHPPFGLSNRLTVGFLRQLAVAAIAFGYAPPFQPHLDPTRYGGDPQ